MMAIYLCLSVVLDDQPGILMRVNGNSRSREPLAWQVSPHTPRLGVRIGPYAY